MRRESEIVSKHNEFSSFDSRKEPDRTAFKQRRSSREYLPSRLPFNFTNHSKQIDSSRPPPPISSSRPTNEPESKFPRHHYDIQQRYESTSRPHWRMDLGFSPSPSPPPHLDPLHLQYRLGLLAEENALSRSRTLLGRINASLPESVLSQLNSNLDYLETQVRALSAEKDELASRLLQSNHELGNASKHIEYLEAENTDLRVETRLLQEEMKEMEKKMKVANELILEKTIELEKLNSSRTSKQAAVRDNQQRIQALIEENNQLKATLFEEKEELKRMKELSEQSFDGTKSELERVQKENEVLQKNLNDYVNSLENLKVKAKEDSLSTGTLLQKLKSELGVLEETNRKMNEQNSQLKAANFDFKGRTEIAEKESLHYKNRYETLKVERDQLVEELEKLRAEKESWRVNTNSYETKEQQIEGILRDTQRELLEVRNANTTYHEMETKLRNKIKELETTLSNHQTELDSYQPRLEILIARNRELDQKNQELSALLNKAIEAQAKNYRATVVSEVKDRAEKIIQKFGQTEASISKKSETENSEKRSKLNSSKQEKELKMKVSKKGENEFQDLYDQRVTQHKNRVSESANRLLELLAMDKESEYTQIHEKMNEYEDRKQDFMTKINKFSEKMKLL